jgi:hypothetical protein
MPHLARDLGYASAVTLSNEAEKWERVAQLAEAELDPDHAKRAREYANDLIRMATDRKRLDRENKVDGK